MSRKPIRTPDNLQFQLEIQPELSPAVPYYSSAQAITAVVTNGGICAVIVLPVANLRAAPSLQWHFNLRLRDVGGATSFMNRRPAQDADLATDAQQLEDALLDNWMRSAEDRTGSPGPEAHSCEDPNG
jgi:hypothetical protein